MAHAKICDRCGGVYGKNTNNEDFGPQRYGTVKGICVMFEDVNRDDSAVVVNGIERRRNAYMDLCDDCVKKITLLLKDKDATVEASVKPASRW